MTWSTASPMAQEARSMAHHERRFFSLTEFRRRVGVGRKTASK
jgi:hypothetical protein